MAFNEATNNKVATEHILEKIAAFDFNNSVQVDVIFEESDEDNTETSQIKQEIDPTATLQQIYSCDTISSNNQSINNKNVITNVKTERIDVGDELNKVDMINLTADDLQPKMAVPSTINEIDFSNQTEIVDTNVYRKHSSITDTEAISEIIDQIALHAKHQTETVKTTVNKRSNSIAENSCDQLESSKKRAKTNETTTSKIRIEARDTVLVTAEKQNHLESYIKNLLKSVSEYLIYIVESYCYYMRAKLAYPSEIEKYKNYFHREKSKYFSFAYCTLSNIIVPQENDSNFIKSFLNDTLALSKSMNKGIRTTAEIEPFLRELIMWTKRLMEKHRLQANSVNTQIVNKPDSNALSTITLYGANNTTSVVPANVDTSQGLILFEKGPPGREISISLPALPHQPINPNQNLYIPQTKNLQAHTASAQHQSHIPQTKNPQAHTASVQHQSQFLNYGQPSDPGAVTLQPRPNIYQKNPVLSTLLSHNASSEYLLHSINPVQPNSTRNESQRLPPPWLDNRITALANQYVANTPNINEVQNTDTIRSVSRDSGFGSPLYFGNSSEPTNNENIQTIHVQNPGQQLQYHMDGRCHVCGKITKKMCVICVAQYYCSTQCQYADWPVHMSHCKPKK